MTDYNGVCTGMSVRWEHFVNSYDTRPSSSTSPSTSTSLESTSQSSNRNALFVREFASVVSVFSDRTDALIEIYNEILTTIAALAVCAYTPLAFSTLLASIQTTIDQLNLEGYANLGVWVARLDEKIEAVLIERLRKVITIWCDEFTNEGDGSTTGRGERKKGTEVVKVSWFGPLSSHR